MQKRAKSALFSYLISSGGMHPSSSLLNTLRREKDTKLRSNWCCNVVLAGAMWSETWKPPCNCSPDHCPCSTLSWCRWTPDNKMFKSLYVDFSLVVLTWSMMKQNKSFITAFRFRCSDLEVEVTSVIVDFVYDIIHLFFLSFLFFQFFKIIIHLQFTKCISKSSMFINLSSCLALFGF